MFCTWILFTYNTYVFRYVYQQSDYYKGLPSLGLDDRIDVWGCYNIML